MRSSLGVRRLSGGSARWLAVTGALSMALPAFPQAAFVQNGSAGFVVSDIKYALADDAAKTGACPHGMSLNAGEIFAKTPQGKRKKGESDEQYAHRLQEGAQEFSTASNGQNLCMNPEAGKPDPNFRTVDAGNIRVDGIDLDGPHGERSVENQFYRVVGCTRSFQSSGLSNSFATEMLTGAWGILITLSGVHDIHNDASVDVGIFANADPIQLSPSRAPLVNATYAIDQDPRFRARTKGRIHDGVLTTDPVDVRFHWIVNGLHLERPLRHARLRVTVSENGTLSGYLAGYTPVEAMYDMQYGYRNGKTASGELAPLPLRLHTGNGAAAVLGHTCQGAYFALNQYADGDPDPKTGRFTSISTQYRLTAIPAFVVDEPTESSNAKLIEKAKPHDH
jgi:hypothetical protein